MNKKITIASAAVLTLAAAAFTVPSVFAQTTSTVKGMGQQMMERGDCAHKGLFGDTKFLEQHASILGITVDDLKARMESGKSIKDIAADLGISEESLQAKMKEIRAAHQAERKAEMKTRIQQKVTDGKITQAQADEMLANLENPKEHGFGEGRGRGFGKMMPRSGWSAEQKADASAQ